MPEIRPEDVPDEMVEHAAHAYIEAPGGPYFRDRLRVALAVAWPAIEAAVRAQAAAEIDAMWDQIHRDQHTAMEAHAQADALRERLAELEAAICFETTCLSCARTLTGAIQERERAEKAEAILRDLVDPHECYFDHHGFCQAHGHRSSCPHARAAELLATIDQPARPAEQAGGPPNDGITAADLNSAQEQP